MNMELEIKFNDQQLTLEIDPSITVLELKEYFFLNIQISAQIEDWECFSEQKQQFLKLNDNFEYTKRDKLIISKKEDYILQNHNINVNQQNGLWQNDLNKLDKTLQFDVQIDYNREPEQMTIEIDPNTQFEELLEYLAARGFPDLFYECTKILGPYKSWLGSSEKLGKNVNLSEKLGNYQQDTIKIGPIHIISTEVEYNIGLKIIFYYIQNIIKD